MRRGKLARVALRYQLFLASPAKFGNCVGNRHGHAESRVASHDQSPLHETAESINQRLYRQTILWFK